MKTSENKTKVIAIGLLLLLVLASLVYIKKGKDEYRAIHNFVTEHSLRGSLQDGTEGERECYVNPDQDTCPSVTYMVSKGVCEEVYKGLFSGTINCDEGTYKDMEFQSSKFEIYFGKEGTEYWVQLWLK